MCEWWWAIGGRPLKKRWRLGDTGEIEGASIVRNFFKALFYPTCFKGLTTTQQSLILRESNSVCVPQNAILEIFPSRSYGVMVSTLDFESSDPSSNLGRTSHNLTPWRNGSASDSRSEGCVFESRRGQNLFPTCRL